MDIAKSVTNAILLNDVPSDTFFSLKEAVSKQSVSSGQGYKKCNCKAAKNQCKTNGNGHALRQEFCTIPRVIWARLVVISNSLYF